MPESKPVLSGRQLYLRLLHYVLPYWHVFLVSIAAMVVVALSAPAFPALLKPLLDGSFVEKDQTTIQWAPFLLIALFLVRGLATYVSKVSIGWVATRLVADLRELMFHKLINLPTGYYDDNSSGSMIANVAFNVTQVTRAGTNAVTVMVREVLTIIGLLGWMLYLNWKLTLVALAVAPPIAIIFRAASVRLRAMSRKAQRSMGDVTHVLEESIEGHKVVKVFGGQQYESKRFHEAVERSRKFQMKQLAAAAANVPIVQFLAALALA
ncbi:MAG: ABC transporter transmembrane domain-containing protein, partial [Burkholderiales bacterium]